MTVPDMCLAWEKADSRSPERCQAEEGADVLRGVVEFHQNVDDTDVGYLQRLAIIGSAALSSLAVFGQDAIYE